MNYNSPPNTNDDDDDDGNKTTTTTTTTTRIHQSHAKTKNVIQFSVNII